MAKKNLIQEGTRILSENTVMTKKEGTTLDTVTGGIDAFAADIELIMVDYIADPAMIDEIRERTRQLREQVANPVKMLHLDRETRCKQLEDYNKEIISLKEEVDERDDTIKDLRGELDEFKDKEPDPLTYAQLIEQLKEKDGDELDNADLLHIVGEEGVKEWADDHNYICVKVENLVQREKVETFLTTEIWPEFNLQSANLNF